MNDDGPQHHSDSEQETNEQQDAEHRDDADGARSEDRLEEMEQPYPGPEEEGGITAHGIEGETDLRRAKQYAEMVVDTVREGLLVLDFDLQVEAANKSFYRMFEVDPTETEGRLIYNLGNGQWDIPELRELLEEILPEHNVMTGFEVTREFENIGQRVMRLNARQLNDHQRILLAIEDITRSEEAKEQLRMSEDKLREMNRSLEKRVEKRTAELRQQTERLRHLAAELASAEQRERRRLASLLHDDLQQLLYGAEMQLGVARGKTETEEARAAITEASEQISEAVETARNLTRQLRPPALYEAGLRPALEWLASDMDERYGLEVTLDTEEMETDAATPALSDDLKAMLYECARELLFNVVKYAEVSEARITLRTDPAPSEPAQDDERKSGPDRLHLVVEDEGRGFEVDRAIEESTEEGGFGLLSIQERIAALGGSMEIDSRPGEGTRVELRLPLSPSLDTESDRPRTPVEVDDEPQADVPSQQTQVRVVIADDHAVVRQGIANLLVADERTTVVGEAATGKEQSRPSSRSAPTSCSWTSICRK